MIGDYRTSRGREYSFYRWDPGESPTELFDAGRWLECLHACMVVASKNDLEDDAILHELVHLALGIPICQHGDMEGLRARAQELETIMLNRKHFDVDDLVKIDGAPPNLRSVLPGNKVMLRSGGPKMTVVICTHNGDRALCEWRVGGETYSDSFPLASLTCYAPKWLQWLLW